jgi:GT2 family glycosyltransferase
MDWSMVICTLNRFEVLKCALRTVLWQTRPPRQVIVVDASPDWQRCRDEVQREFAAGASAIEWIYIGSERRSLTHQRNLGLGRCTSPIVFFFDDDTFLYPDCAARILSVYERDARGEVGGVSAGLSGVNPLERTAAVPADSSPPANPYTGWRERVRSLWYPEQLFLPYDGQYYRRMPGWAIADRSLMTVAVFHGCRMTFRTAAVREAGGCEEVLERHCFSEDIDISHRVSQRHALLLDMDALVFHAAAPASRTGRIPQATLVLLNSSVLYLLHASEPVDHRSRVRRFVLGRLAIETVRDALKPWRGFPNARGAIAALRELRPLLRLSREELRRTYPQVQQRITDSRRDRPGTAA